MGLLSKNLEGVKFARKCSITGKGINSGFVFHDGEEYAGTKAAAELVAKKLGYKSYNDAYKGDNAYWTDWEGDDFQYIVKNRELVDIE